MINELLLADQKLTRLAIDESTADPLFIESAEQDYAACIATTDPRMAVQNCRQAWQKATIECNGTAYNEIYILDKKERKDLIKEDEKEEKEEEKEEKEEEKDKDKDK